MARDPRLRRAPHARRPGGPARRRQHASPTSSRAAGGPIALRVRATLSGESLTLDFEGTDAQVEGNLNCPLSVTRSACFYAVRVVCDPDAPPSAGAWRPVEVIAPEGSLLNARAARRGRRRQRRDLQPRRRPRLRRARGLRPVPAQGQGTMNNLTLAGGRGDSMDLLRDDRRRPGRLPDADGPSAVHVAMSNTLNTPVEALETEFPLRVRELSRAARQRRRGPPPRRRRDRARDRGARADALHADRRAPPPPRRGARGRRRRRARARPPERRADRRRRPRASCARATACGSRPRAAAATARPARNGRLGSEAVERVVVRSAAEIAFVRDRASVTGPTLIFVHGLGGSIDSWRAQLSGRSRRPASDVIALRLPRRRAQREAGRAPTRSSSGPPTLVGAARRARRRARRARRPLGRLHGRRARGPRASVSAPRRSRSCGGALEWRPEASPRCSRAARRARPGRAACDEVAEAVAATGLTRALRAPSGPSFTALTASSRSPRTTPTATPSAALATAPRQDARPRRDRLPGCSPSPACRGPGHAARPAAEAIAAAVPGGRAGVIEGAAHWCHARARRSAVNGAPPRASCDDTG